MGDAQLKAIRELVNIFDAEIKMPERYSLPTPPDLLMNKSTKRPRLEDQTAPPPMVDPYKESSNIDQKSQVKSRHLHHQ